MENVLVFAIIAAFILAYGVISGRIRKTVITLPMAFVVFGLLLGNQGLGLIHLDVEGIFVDTLAELTLILILFTDASRIDLNLLRRHHDVPIRLLVIGMPLTMLLGAMVGAVTFDALTFGQAVVLAIILAPTDAALGQAVIFSPKVPLRIRQALNIESGLNDGITLPILLFFLALAGSMEHTRPVEEWVRFGAAQLLLGPIVGVSIGYFGGKLVDWGERKEWMAESFQRLVALALAVLAFALAELIGGNGFIAAFSAGMTLGNLFKRVCGRLYEFAEAEGELLTLLTFLLFGAIMLPSAFDYFSGSIILYAILSLTVIRMIPVAISLIGLGLRLQTFLFLGWFGPRGIASILYCLLVLGESGLPGRDFMYAVIMITVFISVFTHGLTAVPAANWYGAHAEVMKDEPNIPELVPVTEMPIRLPYHRVVRKGGRYAS